METIQKCPFNVGDIVRFEPSTRTKGLYQNIEMFGVKLGDEVEVKRIEEGLYLYFENDSGGWPWTEFILIESVH